MCLGTLGEHHMRNKPIWHLLQTCAEELTAAGNSPFTRQDLIACIQETDASIGENTINPIIQGVTDNLKGGAPGAVGKGILHSVARGKFVLCDSSVTAPNTDQAAVTRLDANAAEHPERLSMPRSEAAFRDALVGILSRAVSNADLEPEGSVRYSLPSGRCLSHASDILVTRPGSDRKVSIEIKYRSAVTDQFKARAYDAAHMKRTHGDKILTILLFAKSTTGISIDHARAISYEFDRFYGNAASAFLEPGGTDELAREINEFLGT